MDTFIAWFNYFAQILYYINPVAMFIASIAWIALYCRTKKELDRAYIRMYALEKQIDYVVNHKERVDKECFNFMKKIYTDLENKKL